MIQGKVFLRVTAAVRQGTGRTLEDKHGPTTILIDHLLLCGSFTIALLLLQSFTN
jgi:hypothetical protein